MSLFCLLWTPLFYLFWHSIAGDDTAAGGVWALLVGSIVAIFQFFLGYLVEPGGFGFSRWMSGFVDIVTLPALSPLIIYIILISLKVISGNIDFTNFALLWLIPGAAIRTVNWSSQNDPVLLVLVPILWTAIAVGIPFFINLILHNRRWVIAPASLGILVVPLAAASSYWAYYSQKVSLGFLFLFIAAAPMMVSMSMSFFGIGEND